MISNKRGQAWVVLVVILVLIIVGWFIINNAKIAYKSDQSIDPTLYCDNGEPQRLGGFLGELAESISRLRCFEYESSEVAFECDENNNPVIICKATIWEIYSKPKS